MSTSASLISDREFRAYLSATACTQLAFSMQQLLSSWMFIGVLHENADKVGVAQALIGAPGLLLMLWGGAHADRRDQRATLMLIYGLAVIPPVLLAAFVAVSSPTFMAVTLWSLSLSIAASMSSPALQAMLSRICGGQVQQGVTFSIAIGYLVQLAGLSLAGEIETLSLVTVLLIQGLFIGAGALLMQRLSESPATHPTTSLSTLQSIAQGFRIVAQHSVVGPVMVLNLISTLFNAGAFAIVFPYLMTKVYGGDARFLALTMVVFYFGAMLTNFAMLRIMPILYLGRWFLLMQLSRVVIMAVLWSHPPEWLLFVCILAWGLNMGVTTTTSRAMVQESTDTSHRGRVLAVFNFGAIGAQPVGALLLGVCIAQFGVLNAFVPGITVSLAIYLIGITRTDLWRYESPAARAQLA